MRSALRRWVRRLWCWLTATEYVITMEGRSPESVWATAEGFATHFAHYQAPAWITVTEDNEIIVRCTALDAARFL